MRAAVYYGPGDVRVEDIERPRAGDEGMILRVRACGICGTDLHPYRKESERCPTGFALGHEYSGDVVEVGPKVTGIEVGDRVWGRAFLPCFQCERCRVREYGRCRNYKLAGVSGLHGGFAEYLWFPLVLPNENVIKLASNMSYHDGTLIEPMTAGTSVSSRTKLDDVVVVLGVGTIGLGVVAHLKAKGVARVIVSDVSKKRLEVAGELGADIVIDPSEEDLVRVVMEQTSNVGADIVVNTAGVSSTFQQSIDIVRRAGTILVGAHFEEPFMFNPSLHRPGLPSTNFVAKGVTMVGGFGQLPSEGLSWFKSFELIKAGSIRDSHVVTHVFPLEKIREAFETQMNNRESIKVMVEP